MNKREEKINKNQSLIEIARSVVQTELRAVETLKDRIDNRFIEACQLILHCKGHVIVIGMGKSGHIGNKIAATLTSTGTPAFSIHPGEASHGDMGVITDNDVVLAISNSGETVEVLTLLPLLKQNSVPLITFTGKIDSTLAKSATVNIDIGVKKEACSLGLAPTSSTTTTLVMGDALAVTLLEARGFTSQDFARFHPGGELGRHLLLEVKEVMRKGDAIPVAKPSTKLTDALVEMTKKTLGMTTILSDDGKLIGIYTDGDLRRTLDDKLDIHTTSIEKVMTAHPITIKSTILASEALQLMEDKKITSLVVTDDQNRMVGVVHIHDLLN